MRHLLKPIIFSAFLGIFIVRDKLANAMDVPPSSSALSQARPSLKRRAGPLDELPAPKQAKIEGQDFHRKYVAHPKTEETQEKHQDISGRRKVKAKKSEAMLSLLPVLGLNVKRDSDTEEEEIVLYGKEDGASEDDDDDLLFQLGRLGFGSKQ